MFDTVELDAPPEVPLSRCRPSGWLALELDVASDDTATADDGELIEALVAFDRVASWALARQARVLAEFARRRPPDRDPAAARSSVAAVASEFAPDEVALALRQSRLAASARLEQAVMLESALPETLLAWERGIIDATKVRAIVQACRPLSVVHARAVQDRVLPSAGEQTPGQLRVALARAVIAVDPDGAADRHDHARRERRVVLTPEADGMAGLWALLPAPDAVAAYQHLGALARSLGADDPRGMDARRADLLADLLTGRCAAARCAAGRPGDADGSDDRSGNGEQSGGGAEWPGAGEQPGGGAERSGAGEQSGAAAQRFEAGDRDGCAAPAASGRSRTRRAKPRACAPTVHVTVPITTLMGLDEAPGELRGYGPIPAPLARRIAAEGTWRRLLTDPVSGTLLDHGRTTYAAPVALADHVRARDHECRSPVCRRSAADADLDHTIAWNDGGTTADPNLYAACRHHHRLKTHGPGWRVTQHPDATVIYTTPTGHHYTSRPHDYRSDSPGSDPDPPPF